MTHEYFDGDYENNQSLKKKDEKKLIFSFNPNTCLLMRNSRTCHLQM